jgi:hypothetical protein
VSAPELAVVVGSHERPLRLRWLLNALEQQTLGRALWEVGICHVCTDLETTKLLAEHSLAREGVLRSTTLPGTVLAGANRNAALRLTRAPVVVFTDDDCRPPEDWLANVLAAVRANPGAIVQGPVAPDPDEQAMLRSSHPHSQQFSDVPRVWAETCNIAYPRAVIDAIGGLAEDLSSGEDTDLNLRAKAAGAAYVGDQTMLTYHAVEEGTALDVVRGARRWEDLTLLLKRHPEIRGELYARVFWKQSHGWLALAAAAGALAPTKRAKLALASAPVIGWAIEHRSPRSGLRGRLRDLLELPGCLAIDLAELLVLARGSVRHRTLML